MDSVVVGQLMEDEQAVIQRVTVEPVGHESLRLVALPSVEIPFHSPEVGMGSLCHNGYAATAVEHLHGKGKCVVRHRSLAIARLQAHGVELNSRLVGVKNYVLCGEKVIGGVTYLFGE